MGNLFVNPAMLWGALAVSAPIIIWLLTRYRYRTVDFAALVFLQRALKKQQRRLQVENLLLLLIRCLLLLLFVLALARPRSVGPVLTNEDDAARNVVLLVDTSWSTGYQVGSDQEETVHARARRAAKELVAGLEDGDRVLLVAYDQGVRPLYQKPRQLNDRVRREVLQDIEDAPEMQRSERATELAEALHALPRLLRTFDFDASGAPPPEGARPLEKTVFLITDAQREGLLDPSGQPYDRTLPAATEELKKQGGALVLLDCGAEEPKNLSLTHLATREPVVGRELPCHIEAAVRNWSAQDVGDLLVEYYVDGAASPQKSVSLNVRAGEARTPDPLRYVFHEPGQHTVEVRLKSDALMLDNRRHIVVDVREHVKVLLVDGERARERWLSETDFVEEVLSLSEAADGGPGLLRPEVVVEADIASRELESYDVVLVANVTSLDDEAAAALERYTRGGGAVIFTMGPQVDAAAYNETLWRKGLGLLPCRLLEVKGGTRAEAEVDVDAPAWVMQLGDADGHVVSLFRDEEMATWLRLPSIYGFFTVDTSVPGLPDEQNPVRVPLRVSPRPADDALDAPLADGGGRAGLGQPLLVEKPFGRGRAVVWLSTVDPAWNNCVLYDGFYLPFWRQLVLDESTRARPPLNLSVGGRYERLLRAEEYAARIEVETPDGRRESVTLERVGEQELYRLVYPGDDERGGLQESGLYTITRRGVAGAAAEPPPDHFSVSIDAREGDLARFSPQELSEALGVTVKPLRPEGAREALRADGGVSSTREYWRELLVAVVALLALESILAALFGRRRR